ncbi:urease accessory protein UreF [Streptomyces sp. enrichment culture]|uniref:urease accessory protein UreF n=1 Tax=Streptomyces sp. enrichment culture TaxID=1795815 RepID=UPI003F5574C7
MSGNRSAPAAPTAALLMLADGRFPAGGHAHSGGLEAAVAAGRVVDTTTLEAFLRGRAATSGATAAAFAAAACTAAGSGPAKTADTAGTGELDTEFEARTPAPALRAASRKLGRQLLRAARTIRPAPALDALAASLPAGPHQPIALGAVAHSLGLGAHAAAAATLHDAVTGPATAAVRLLGLDPFAVHAVLARLAPELDRLADAADAHAAGTPAHALASPAAPLLDILAEHHATWEVRLFAS